MSELPKPPADLDSPGRELWSSMTRDYDLSERELALLATTCRTLEELLVIEAALASGELWVPGSKGQRRPTPLLHEARQHRATLQRLLASFDVEADVSPAKLTSLAASRMALTRHHGRTA